MLPLLCSKIAVHRHHSMRIECSGSFVKVRERSRASWSSDRDRPTIRLLLFRRPSDEDPTVPMSRDANRSMKITIATHTGAHVDPRGPLPRGRTLCASCASPGPPTALPRGLSAASHPCGGLARHVSFRRWARLPHQHL